jgi:hypothetical protein
VPWWKREPHISAPVAYTPATDEGSLDRCVRRLQEILAELGPIGEFLENTGDLSPGEDLARRVADQLNRVRASGYCAYKLASEAWTLLELIAVRVIALRKVYDQTGQSRKLSKLDAIQAATEQAEPMVRETLAELEAYSSLDGGVQLQLMLKRKPMR